MASCSIDLMLCKRPSTVGVPLALSHQGVSGRAHRRGTRYRLGSSCRRMRLGTAWPYSRFLMLSRTLSLMAKSSNTSCSCMAACRPPAGPLQVQPFFPVGFSVACKQQVQ